MAITVGQVLGRAQATMQDNGVFWPLKELLDWFNDARRELINHKPAANTTNEVLKLQAGSLQRLPDDVAVMLRAYRNVQPTYGASAPLYNVPLNDRQPGRVVRIVDRHVMDSQQPGWHTDPPQMEAEHYIVDEIDPKSFYVYPPNNGTGYLEVAVARWPDELEWDEGEAFLAAPIGIPDAYSTALVDYVLFRAYSKDSNLPVNEQRSQNHYALFAQAIGIRSEGLFGSSPVTEAKISKEAGL